MHSNEFISLKSLWLDLRNFRTVPQPDETHAINAMISINPDWFWALLESILEDGYHPTENIIVQQDGGKHVVKEGNRRIAALKIILKYASDIDIPDTIKEKIDQTTKDWRAENSKVPCAVYSLSESNTVDKIVSLTHAKGEKAGRDKWNAVAKARYGRDQKGVPEPGLDLLEKYLENGKNLSPQQSERWSGDYPLTVLNEAIQKLAPHLGLSSAKDLAEKYPKQKKLIIDKILYDIGIDHLGFNEIRDKNNFFGTKYGILIPNAAVPKGLDATRPSGSSRNEPQNSSFQDGTKIPTAKSKSHASNDPKSVYRMLNSFKPKGKNRDKLVTLLDEAKTLKIDKHPHAFCFLLRSMFELSAKAYCLDHQYSGGPSANRKDGKDKELRELLRDITNHMINNNNDKNKLKELHGAMTELAKSDGLLSVTSMNQLV